MNKISCPCVQNAGVDFPPREENTVPLFTPPQTQPLRQPHLYPPPGQSYEDAAIQASLQSSAPSAPALRCSFVLMQNLFVIYLFTSSSTVIFIHNFLMPFTLLFLYAFLCSIFPILFRITYFGWNKYGLVCKFTLVWGKFHTHGLYQKY